MEKPTSTLALAEHCHSHYSQDGESSLQEVVEKAKNRSLDFLFMTEHAEDLDAESWARFVEDCKTYSQGITIVPGLEFRTDEGPHILGLAVKEYHLAKTCVEACEWIRNQGGFSIVAHPDYYMFLLDPPCFDMSLVDAMEVWTAKADTQRCPRKKVLALFQKLKKKYPQLLPVAGLDAHGTYMVSTPNIWVPANSGKQPLELLREGNYKLVGAKVVLDSAGNILKGKWWVALFFLIFIAKKLLQRFAKKWRKLGLPELNHIRKLFRKAF